VQVLEILVAQRQQAERLTLPALRVRHKASSADWNAI